jgi:hypothetical protein
LSRRIETGSRIPARADGKPALMLGDESSYLGRLIGYIPSEMVALYLFCTGVASSGARSAHTKLVASWLITAIVWVLTPIYMWIVTGRGPKGPLWPQIILASIAYPVWVYATGGPFEMSNWYRGWIASIVLAFVTVVFGMYRPAPGS